MENQSIKNRLNEKIAEIENFVSQLYRFIPKERGLEGYLGDLKTKAVCERYFEKIIEATEDLAFLIINYKKFKYPEYEKEVFDILMNNKIIPEGLCKRLKEAKGMRNIIAHKYGKIDDELVFEAITEQLEKDINEFIDVIRKEIR